ncbi:protoporphyrinogen oxidase [Paraliobacillus sp. X-1268]|uniref:protoporphyrinogen oxidase n=1 Tax=Paraliobacillus sp. X-1268 TaxID=2213193 RepID=UPI000E3DA809|nr:protoporphyrinogen oxidase [Paraliobacillus sp. X-1268]
MSKQKKIAIIGGGITGLTAAYYLQKEIKTNNLPYKIDLIESSDKLGGKMETIKQDGFTIERGPDSFLIRKESAARLAHEVGIDHDLVKNGTGKAYVLVGDKLHEMPKGSFMGIPTQLAPFLLSNMFSLKGKVRMLSDFVLPKSTIQSDQSVGEFFRRRFGNELLENLIEPLLSGIYAGNIDQLSLMATFPQFYQMEQKHRSLIKGSRETLPKKKDRPVNKTSKFYSLRGGLQSFIDVIEKELDPAIVSIHKETSVDHIEKKTEDYHLLLDNGEVNKADSLILTTAFPVVKRIFSQYDFWQVFGETKATSVANVVLTFDVDSIPSNLDGTGFVVSRNSNYRITACTWTHKKWPNTTPEGKAMLRCYVGRPGDEGVVDLSDAEIAEIALKDLKKIMGISGKPDFHVVTRWRDAMPQYTVGHLDRLNDLRVQMEKELPGVLLAGSGYQGIGIPDCIDQGERAVADILEFLQK